MALAKAVKYDSAGTVEFVAGQDKSFYFLEMNTRLQVEHPVTELVTGIDLVEQMIRVAAGEKLALQQKDIMLTGWAVESRVYAEDPFRNFLPSIGRLIKYRPPAESRANGITVRNDTGVQEGGEISIFYDPMIAKLVTHAPSRAGAIEAQSTALDAFYVDGIRHNIPFLSALMNHPRWREGKLSTGSIAEEFPKGFSAHAPEGEIARRIAAVGAAIDHVLGERKRQISGQLIGRPVKRESRRAVWLDHDEIILDIAHEDGAIAVRFLGSDGKPGQPHHLVSSWKPGDPVWQGARGLDRRQRGAGGQGRRDAGGGRSDEDAERAARRPRRGGEEDSRSPRCDAGGGCVDTGVCLTTVIPERLEPPIASAGTPGTTRHPM